MCVIIFSFFFLRDLYYHHFWRCAITKRHHTRTHALHAVNACVHSPHGYARRKQRNEHAELDIHFLLALPVLTHKLVHGVTKLRKSSSCRASHLQKLRAILGKDEIDVKRNRLTAVSSEKLLYARQNSNAITPPEIES